MRSSMLALTAAVILGGTSESWAGAKPDPTPDWRCQVVFHNRADDKIKTDLYDPTKLGSGGPYVDGIGGVTCKVINEPGATQDRWLFMSITGTNRNPPTRVVKFVGQTYGDASYPSFDNRGTFEVLGLAKVVAVAARDVMPFRAYVRGPDVPSEFTDGLATVAGDSNEFESHTIGADDPTSSVFVQRVDQCSWDVTSYTTEEPELFSIDSVVREQFDTQTNRLYPTPRVMRITEGKFDLVHSSTLVGDFPMPFAVTVILTPHPPTTLNPSGCPQ